MADETSAGASLLQSPLHDRHVALGARLAEFGGWSMPLEYPGGVVAEPMEFATPSDDARSLRRRTMAEQPP